MRQVECPYCLIPAELADSAELYGQSYGPIWICRSCGAYVGCHKNSKDNKPLGKMANASTRRARTEAHAVFDRLWMAKMRRDKCSKRVARQAGYAWLASKLGYGEGRCHIAWMDEGDCYRVTELCKRFLTRQ